MNSCIKRVTKDLSYLVLIMVYLFERVADARLFSYLFVYLLVFMKT